jgi:hypothetical protein
MNIDTVTQRDLDSLPEGQREYDIGAMVHNAGGDSKITLRVFVATILKRIRELYHQDIENDEDDQGVEMRKLREDFCFIGLDL